MWKKMPQRFEKAGEYAFDWVMLKGVFINSNKNKLSIKYQLIWALLYLSCSSRALSVCSGPSTTTRSWDRSRSEPLPSLPPSIRSCLRSRTPSRSAPSSRKELVPSLSPSTRSLSSSLSSWAALSTSVSTAWKDTPPLQLSSSAPSLPCSVEPSV